MLYASAFKGKLKKICKNEENTFGFQRIYLYYMTCLFVLHDCGHTLAELPYEFCLIFYDSISPVLAWTCTTVRVNFNLMFLGFLKTSAAMVAYLI